MIIWGLIHRGKFVFGELNEEGQVIHEREGLIHRGKLFLGFG